MSNAPDVNRVSLLKAQIFIQFYCLSNCAIRIFFALGGVEDEICMNRKKKFLTNLKLNFYANRSFADREATLIERALSCESKRKNSSFSL